MLSVVKKFPSAKARINLYPMSRLKTVLKGRAIRVKPSHNITTDYIISGRYKFSIQDPKELAKHIFEDLEPGFVKRMKVGDILVAGKNFGMGSSREQAPLVIKTAGIRAVLAQSFARIFYRNSFNIGLILIECDTSKIKDKNQLELDLEKGLLKNVTSKVSLSIKPIPQFMRQILRDGGALGHFKKRGGWKCL